MPKPRLPRIRNKRMLFIGLFGSGLEFVGWFEPHSSLSALE